MNADTLHRDKSFRLRAPDRAGLLIPELLSPLLPLVAVILATACSIDLAGSSDQL